jgi:hypothetical protein
MSFEPAGTTPVLMSDRIVGRSRELAAVLGAVDAAANGFHRHLGARW